MFPKMTSSDGPKMLSIGINRCVVFDSFSPKALYEILIGNLTGN